MLGRLLFVTIRHNMSIPYPEVQRIWSDLSLPSDWMPALRSPEDAFRKATPKKEWDGRLSLLDYQGNATLEGSNLEAVLIYARDDDASVDIQTASRAAVFLRADGEIGITPFTPLRELELAYLDRIKARFAQLRTEIDGSQIASAIRKIRYAGQVLTYKDGVYLVPWQHFDKADAIVRLMAEANKHTADANTCWDIPYIDTPETQAQMIEVLYNHLETTSLSLIEQGKEVIPSTRKVSRSDSLRGGMNDLDRMVDSYEQLLGKLPSHRVLLAQRHAALRRVLPQ